MRLAPSIQNELNQKIYQVSNNDLKCIDPFVMYAWVYDIKKITITFKMTSESISTTFEFTKNILYDKYLLKQKIQSMYNKYQTDSILYLKFKW